MHKETGEKILETLLERNEFLQSIGEVEKVIEKNFSKPGVGGTTHYILKCDLIVREVIHKKPDKIKLEWGVYAVRDKYHDLLSLSEIWPYRGQMYCQGLWREAGML